MIAQAVAGGTALLERAHGAGVEPTPLDAVAQPSGPEDLATLVRQWVALSRIVGARPRVPAVAPPRDGVRRRSPNVCEQVLDGARDAADPTTTAGTEASSRRLFVFVGTRLRERAALAAEAGDALMQRFTDWEVDWVDRAWSDAVQHPHRVAELERYLLRTAQRYRRHPEFDIDWRLPVKLQSCVTTDVRSESAETVSCGT